MPGYSELPILSGKLFEDELKGCVKEEQSWMHDWANSCEKANSTALLLKGTGEDKAGELKELLQSLEEQYSRLQAAIEARSREQEQRSTIHGLPTSRTQIRTWQTASTNSWIKKDEGRTKF